MTDSTADRLARTRKRVTLRARLIQIATTLDRLGDYELDVLEDALDIVDGQP